MAKPVQLLGDVRGFYRDLPRDRLPEGYMWDIADFIPALLAAQLTGRGGWAYGSQALPGPIQGGIHATFKSGDRLLMIANGTLCQVAMTAPGAVTSIGAVNNVVQNPVLLADQVIIPGTANAVPKVITATSSAVTIGTAGAGAPTGRYATVYKERVLASGGTGLEERIYFSPVRDATAAWDATRSWQGTSLPLTGLGALRAMILAFHSGSVERIRGSEPASEGNPEGDLNLENMFDRAGCGDARSIAYWNDNCIFADERGVHLTDGAIVRNLISQGGLVIFWRELFANRISIAAETYLDYYIITVVRSDGVSVTLVCDLQRRSWFRFTNLKSVAYIRSFGTQEQLWAGRSGDNRLMTVASCFFPLHSATIVDGDGTAVLPVIETPFHKLGDVGLKRFRFVYTHYDIRTAPYTTMSEEGNGTAKTALAQLLEVGYILGPMKTTYTVAGLLPDTVDGERRYRLPVNKQRYGIGLRFRQVVPSVGTHIYDIEVEAQAAERSRL